MTETTTPSPESNDPVVNISFRVSGLQQLMNLLATPDYQLRSAILTDLQAQANRQLQPATSTSTESQS
jgi:hypothetical protein